MLAGFIDFLGSSVFNLIGLVLSVLPVMPDLSEYLADLGSNPIVSSVLGFVNYFLPIQTAVTIVSAWAGGMIIYIAVKQAVKFTRAAK